MTSITLGKRIMTLRKAKGMTQEQLAEKLNVSPQAVSKWENDVSCPDISILAQLATVLSVSTDELLGVKEIEPRVVVVDAGAGRDGGRRKDEPPAWKASAKGGLYFALALILIGAVFLLSRAGVLPFDGITLWGMAWPALLLGIGVSWLIEHRSPMGGGVALLGLYFLLHNLGVLSFTLSWGVIWPALLILLGITMILDRYFPNRGKWKEYEGMEHAAQADYGEAEGFVRMDVSFCEDNRVFAGDSFTGGDLDVSFGKAALDLRRAKAIRTGAHIRVDVSFATLELILPRTVRVEKLPDKAFGAAQVNGSPDEDAQYSIQVSGEVSFGSMVIQYI